MAGKRDGEGGTAGGAGARSRRRLAGRSGGGTNGEPPLSPARIAAAAIAILDTDGLDGLSMRKLADRLGAGVMSLYWHVASKDAVLDLALDAVLALRGPQAIDPNDPDPADRVVATPVAHAPAIDEPGCPQDWRADIAAMAGDWRAAMLAHPWSAALLPSRPLGASMLARLEALGAALSRAGVAQADVNAAIWSLWNHVIGATVTRASFAASHDDRAAADRDGPAAPATAAYPTITRTRLLEDDDWDGAFRKGLGFLLDAIAPRR